MYGERCIMRQLKAAASACCAIDCGQHPSGPEKLAQYDGGERIPATVAAIADAVRLGRRNHAGNRPKMAAAATRFLLWKTHFDPWAKGPSLLGIQPVVFPS